MNFKPNILIVDDDFNNIVVLRELIKKRIVSAYIFEATNGYDALKIAENRTIHLGIFDVKMPGMHGFELTKIFRQKHKNNPVPVILLTAIYNDVENVIKGYNAGAVDYMVKPFSNEMLINKIKIFLELASSRQEIKDLNEILEKKLAISDHELNNSRQSLKMLYNTSAIGLYKMSLDGEIAVLNPAAQQMIGIDSEEASHTIVESNLKTLRMHHAHLHQNGNNGNSLEHELSFELQNGDKIHLLDNAHLMIDNNSTPKHVEGSLINITPIIENKNIFALQKNLSYELIKANDLKNAGEIIINNLLNIHGIEIAGFYSYNHESKELHLSGIAGASAEFIKNVKCYPQDSPEYQLISNGEIKHLTCDEMTGLQQEFLKNEGIKALLVIPVVREKTMLGAINLATKTYCNIPDQAIRMVKSLVPLVVESLYRISFYTLQQQSNHNLINLFNSIEDYITVFDHRGNIISVNNAVEEKLGYRLEDLKGQPVEILHPPEIRKDAARIVGEMIASGQKFCTLPIMNANQHQIPVETLVTEAFWNGQKVMIGISRDMSGRIEQERELKFRYDFETIMTHASLRFLNISIEKTDEAINETLGEIGEFIGADRSYIFFFSDDRQTMSNTHEWCAAGIEPQIDVLQELDQNTFSWSLNLLSQKVIINYYDVHEMPEDTDGTKEILLMQDIKSIILVPVHFESKLIGFCGFDAVKEKRNFSEDTEKMLNVASGIFANAVEHRRKNIELKNYRESLEQKVVNRTKELTETNQLLKREIEQRIEAEKELLKVSLALEQSAIGVIITSLQGTIEYANPFMSKITGFSRHEIVGHKPSLFRLPGKQQKAHLQIEKAVATGVHWNGEIINKHKDGHEITLKLSITPISNRVGEIIHFIAIYEDISQQKQMEKQLVQSQKMEAVGLLAGGIAHDFNNLLQIIKVYSEISRLATTNKDVHASLGQIDAAIERGSKTVGALVKYSRKKQPNTAVFNLSQAVKDFLPVIKSVMPSTINIKCDIENNVTIHGDSNQIEQVIINLIMNAKDAMKNRGSINLNVSKNHRYKNEKSSGKYALITIGDNGAGMDDKTIQRIFDPFFSTKKIGEGNGLGLSIVAGIIKNHKGHIEVESKPGIGSQFYIYLPETL
jgi:PAS domain S-box-containing protein